MSAYRSKGGTLVSLTEVRETVERQQLLFPDDATVRSYADRMQKGDEFEPVKVIKRQDGCYDLKDGHHRFAASQRCSFTYIPVEIIERPSVAAQ